MKVRLYSLGGLNRMLPFQIIIAKSSSRQACTESCPRPILITCYWLVAELLPWYLIFVIVMLQTFWPVDETFVRQNVWNVNSVIEVNSVGKVDEITFSMFLWILQHPSFVSTLPCAVYVRTESIQTVTGSRRFHMNPKFAIQGSGSDFEVTLLWRQENAKKTK